MDESKKSLIKSKNQVALAKSNYSIIQKGEENKKALSKAKPGLVVLK